MILFATWKYRYNAIPSTDASIDIIFLQPRYAARATYAYPSRHQADTVVRQSVRDNHDCTNSRHDSPVASSTVWAHCASAEEPVNYLFP